MLGAQAGERVVDTHAKALQINLDQRSRPRDQDSQIIIHVRMLDTAQMSGSICGFALDEEASA